MRRNETLYQEAERLGIKTAEGLGVLGAIRLERLAHQATRVELWRERYNRAAEGLEHHKAELERLERISRGEDV